MSGLSETGFEIKRLDQIQSAIENGLINKLGTLNTNPDSTISQIIGIIAYQLALIWEEQQNTYLNTYPSSASGVSLERVAEYIGITRLQPTASTGTIQLMAEYSDAPLVILDGKQASSSSNGEVFELVADATIQKSAVQRSQFFLEAPTPGQTFSIFINSTEYDITALSSDVEAVAEQLRDEINTAQNNVTAVSNPEGEEGSIILTVNDLSSTYSTDYGDRVEDSDMRLWSPGTVVSLNLGQIVAPVYTIDTIETPVSGWQEVTNLAAVTPGRALETDAELRSRMIDSVYSGNSTPDAIRTKVLNDVPGVTDVVVIENESNTRISRLTFDINFVTGNNIDMDVNGAAITTVPYNTSQAQTMTDLADELLNDSEIYAVNIDPEDTRTLEIYAETIVIENIVVSGGANQADGRFLPGVPGKAFETVVQGATGQYQAVANRIFEVKPAGIQAFGAINETVTDSQGITHNIGFSEPIDIYSWVTVNITKYSEEDFPNDGVDLIKQAIVDYGSTLGLNNDLLYQRFIGHVFTVPGIATVQIKLYTTTNAGKTPDPADYAQENRAIGATELPLFDVARVIVNEL